MAMELCPSCHGRGGSSRSVHVDNPEPGGSTSREIRVWDTWLRCGGTGNVWVQDPVGSGGTRSGGRSSGARRAPPAKATPEQADRAFARLLTFIALLTAFYFVFGGDWRIALNRIADGNWDADFWVRAFAVAAMTVFVGWLLSRYRAYVRYLRYAAFAAIVLASVLIVIGFAYSS